MKNHICSFGKCNLQNFKGCCHDCPKVGECSERCHTPIEGRCDR